MSDGASVVVRLGVLWPRCERPIPHVELHTHRVHGVCVVLRVVLAKLRGVCGAQRCASRAEVGVALE